MSPKYPEITGRQIEQGSRPVFIADFGSNHDGDLGRALMLTEASIDAGADFVKPQIFHAESLVSLRGFRELGRIGHQESWEKDVYSTYKDASFPLEWVPAIAERCRELGARFIGTSYNFSAVDTLDPFVGAHKIGSGDLTYSELIAYVASKGKPVIMATGASTAEEVDDAIGVYLNGFPSSVEYGQNLVLMQCNTNYTGSSGNLRYSNLRVLSYWRDNYYAQLGLSDHTPGHVAVCAAVALGATVIEKHFTDDRSRPGPDHAFAMEPVEFGAMVDAANRTWEALGDGVKRVEENERESRIVQRRALRYSLSLTAGATLGKRDTIPLRPCPPGALEPFRLDEIVGRTLTRDVEADTLVRLEDFE